MLSYGHVKISVLSIMLLLAQYQIWGGDSGFGLTSVLTEELSRLKQQNSQIIAANKKISAISHPGVHNELREEQLRQVYSMVPNDETFVPLD